MTKRYKLLALGLLLVGLVILAVLFLQDKNIAVLNPKGPIANQQRSLIITATLLMLIVVIPVFILTLYIAWKYRETNPQAKYTPDWDHHPGLEAMWWGLPLAIILVLSVITWQSSYKLDPFRPLDSSKPPIQIQVVALQWKWLFIYPEYNVASVNYLQFPEDTPVNFEITADAPMNSFWIPQLGGQIYAINGMKTQLHLIASEPGDYNGSSANISGKGFAGMKFIARASSQTDFNNWIQSLKYSPDTLNRDTYTELAKPSKDNPPATYVSESALFDMIMTKYMKPAAEVKPAASKSPQSGTQGMKYDTAYN